LVYGGGDDHEPAFCHEYSIHIDEVAGFEGALSVASGLGSILDVAHNCAKR
jgi:hypothetical protein